MSGSVSHEGNGSARNIDGRIAAQIEARRAGHRKMVFHGGSLCSTCLENPPRPNQRDCTECHRKASRDSRARLRAELRRLRALAQQNGDV